MRYVRGALIVGFLGAALLGAMLLDASAATLLRPPVKQAPAPAGPVPLCGVNAAGAIVHRAMTIVDLDVAPDQLQEGTAIRQWAVKIRADFNDACQAAVKVGVGGGGAAGEGHIVTIRPGTNSYTVPATGGSAFHAVTPCFLVQAETPGHSGGGPGENYGPVNFCAKRFVPPPYWTLHGQP